MLIKPDASSGGQGIRQCDTIDELEAAAADQRIWPCLIQTKLSCAVYSVEALFWRSSLVCFSVSRMITNLGAFGPSTVRCYGLPVQEVGELCIVCKLLCQKPQATQHATALVTMHAASDQKKRLGRVPVPALDRMKCVGAQTFGALDQAAVAETLGTGLKFRVAVL